MALRAARRIIEPTPVRLTPTSWFDMAPAPTTSELTTTGAPTFIVGVPRSGTTLLRSLLDEHPRLFVPPAETFAINWAREADPVSSFFEITRYDALYPTGTDARTTLESAMRAAIPAPTSPTAAVVATMEALAAVAGRSDFDRWIEKTPKHHLIVPELLRNLGPDVRVLWMIRDPRATLASQRRRWGKRRILSFARRWAVAEELAARFETSEQVHVVRYESLVTDPNNVMRDVASHLDLEWHDCLLTTTRAGEPWAGSSGYQAVSPASLTRYREELPATTLRAIDALLAPRMKRRGYTPDSSASKALGGVVRPAQEWRVKKAVDKVLALG